MAKEYFKKKYTKKEKWETLLVFPIIASFGWILEIIANNLVVLIPVLIIAICAFIIRR